MKSVFSREQTVSLLLLLCLTFAGRAPAGEVIDPAKATGKLGETNRWYDIRLLNVEGRGWNDTKSFYDRLPAKAEGVVPGSVWSLSRHSSGMCVRFVTDATTLHARWAVTGSNLGMPHMAPTGVSGVDLYVRTARDKWHWLAVGQPKLYPTNTAQLVQGIPSGKREFLLYLPLYNGTASVEIGIPKESRLEQSGPWGPGERKPIVFYGTSITHGACASRTGMPHPAILGRRFNYPTINLGFSGSGKMEPAMAALLAELDPSVYVLDCLPNMTADLVAERVEPFVRTLRQAHPRTPIVLAEDRTYGDSFLVPSKRERNETSRAALRPIYERLKKSGVKDLYYVKGDALLGEDGEATVDSSHPSDLGFMRQADAFAKVLGPLLKK